MQTPDKKNNHIIRLKQNGVVINPKSPHGGFKLKFIPKEDGISFNVNTFFSDSSHIVPEIEDSGTPLKIDNITGPVKKLNDTTFQICFNKLGFNNKKRSNSIWLIAYNKGNEYYKSAVQDININFPLYNEEGKEQFIDFPKIENQPEGVKTIALHAQSNEEVPIHYYVKYGPAYIKGDPLIFVPLPSRTRYPVKISVVAWQYGISGILQSAMPVERSFFIKQSDDDT